MTMTITPTAMSHGHPAPFAENDKTKDQLWNHRFGFKIATGTTTDPIDLTLGSVLSTDPDFRKAHGSGDNPNVIFQVDAVELQLGPQAATISPAEMEKLCNADMYFKISGSEYVKPLREAIVDPWRDRVTAATEAAAYALGEPFRLKNPRKMNLSRDDWEIRIPEALAASVDVVLYIHGYAIPDRSVQPDPDNAVMFSYDDYRKRSAVSYAAALARMIVR